MFELYPIHTTFQELAVLLPSGYLFCHFLIYSQISMTLTCMRNFYCDRSPVDPSCPAANFIERKLRMEIVTTRSGQSLDTTGLLRFAKYNYRKIILFITN